MTPALSNLRSAFTITDLVIPDDITTINNHAFTVLVGYAYQDFVSESLSASNTVFPTDDFLYNNLGLGEGLNNLTNGGSKDGIGMSSWKQEWKLASVFGRINYNYDQRYFINASIRAEGSSKFGANNRWGYFPAVSASWLITNEDFMRGQDVVKELKLRAGYGVTGNMPGDCYPWIGRMNKNSDYAYFGDDCNSVLVFLRLKKYIKDLLI